MKHPIHLLICLLCLLLFLSGCSVGKFIPEGSYLLDEVKIESDNKDIKSSEMSLYVRQNPNAKWFSLFKVPLHIYCASGLDSTRWLNRMLRKIGDAPRIYDPMLAEETRSQMQQAIRNLGYMGATVSLQEKVKGNRIKTVYQIRSGKPYVVSHLAYDIPDMQVEDYLMKDSARSLLHDGMRFDVNVLDRERERMTDILQNNGYFQFNKDFITYRADTLRGSRDVGLTLDLGLYRRKAEDIPAPHRQFRIRSVNFLLDPTFSDYTPDMLSTLDSAEVEGMKVYYSGRPFLRPKLLAASTRLRPGNLYRSNAVSNTYSSFTRFGILKYNNIRFQEVAGSDSAYLDAFVTLNRGKNKSMAFEIEGTNTAGNLGAAASVSFNHRNLFRGSESLTLRVRGAYEAATGQEGLSSSNYTEFGVEASLNFPQFMFPFLSSDFKRRIRASSEVSAKYNRQARPEFARTVASAAWSYRWQHRNTSSHRFDLLDINYIYMSRVSDLFRDYLEYWDQRNPLLRYSYEDLLIVRLGYTYTYNSSGYSAQKTAQRNSYSVRVNLEESGNLLYLFSKMVHGSPNDGQAYQMANIDFAQYVRGDFDFAKNFMIDEKNSLVFHFGLGIAYPYGNSKSLPFEKLYFSGGANSVRGWSVRSLGPGSYQGQTDERQLDYANRTGDIKLDLNLEYRTHLFWKLNGALFVDAGNIWNLRARESQPEGLFKFGRFYKQLAVAYGLGIRFDLDFLILRFDGGMKAINPMYEGKRRYPLIHPRFKRDFAFHFAVGYPF